MARVYDKFLRQRLSRRRLLRGAGGAALGGAGVALVGCTGGGDGGGPDASLTPEDEETVTKDGILRMSHNQVLPSLSPFGATALAPAIVFGPLLFDHLFYVPIDTQEVELLLASNIENPDEQGLEIIVTIKDSLFHDKPPVSGRPVVARDVKASYEAFAADELAPGKDWYRNFLESIEAPDDHTVVIRQSEPYAWVFHPSAGGSPAWSSILPEETLPGHPDQFDLSRDLIGSGRQMMHSNRSGEFFELRRHPNWRVPGEPFLAGLDSSLVLEPAAAQAAFRAADLDTLGALSGAIGNKLEADQLKADLGDDITISSAQSQSYKTLMLKMIPPFDDIRVRKAINLAINRQELIQGAELDPEGGVPAGPVPPAQKAYALPEAEMEEYFRHDPEEARALLEEAGFPFDREFTLKFYAAEGEQKRAQLLKEQFGRVGIKVRIVDEDLLSVWLPNSLQPGDFEMTAYTQLAYDDPVIPLSFYTKNSALGPSTPNGRNNMGFFDDEITAAVDAVNSELNEEARIEKVKAAVRLIMEKQAPMINLYSPVSYTARWNWYKGTITDRGNFGAFNGRRWIDTRMRGF